MSQPSPVRLLAITLQPHSRPRLLFMLTLVAGAAWTAVHDIDDFDQVCVLTLFFQMFASSTGFRPQARRGHFDPILTAATSRLSCARAHWLLSVAPGFAVWFVLALVAWRWVPNRNQVFLSPSAITAVVYVSTLSWALTLPFQRYVGGVVWLALIFTLAAGHQLHALRETFMMSSGSWHDTLSVAGAALIAPIFLVADPGVAGMLPLGVVAAASAALWIGGAVFIARFDGALEDVS